MTGDGSAPHVDVVVLTWNDADDARSAVASALASADVRVSVQVVDNASEVAFTPSGDRRSVLVHRASENLGVGGGRNVGASLGSAPFLCFLDSDATLDEHCLSRLVAPLVADDGIALAAPVFDRQAPEIGAGRAPTPMRKIARGLGLTDRYAPVPHGDGRVWDIEFAIGACQMVRRSSFERIGGIDQSARFGPEDLDMCLRLGDAGFRCVQVADASCDHVARRSSRKWFTRNGMAHAAAVARHYAKRRKVGA